MPPPKARPLKRAKFAASAARKEQEEEEEEEDGDRVEEKDGEEEEEEEEDLGEGEEEEETDDNHTEDERDDAVAKKQEEKKKASVGRKKASTSAKKSATSLVTLYRRMCELMIKSKCHELKRKNTFDAVPGSGISLVDVKQNGKSASKWHKDTQQNNNSRNKKLSAVGCMSGKEGSAAVSITKRSNCNAQFPVAPCVATDMDELMVPEEVFNTITYSRVIYEHNRAECIDRIRSGQVKLLKPSKESIVSYNTEYININSVVPALNTVLECMMDEYNYGVLNRFPTLHKGCFQGLKLVKIPAHKKIDAFLVNMLLTKIMGMDFDGDLAQARPALNPLIAAEIMCLVSMSEQMGSQHGTGSISGLLQNAMVALLLVTMGSCKLTKDLFCDLLTCFHHTDAKTARPLHIRVPKKQGSDSDTDDDYDFPEEKMFSGRQLIQQLSPPGFFYAPGVHADKDMKKFHILNGIVVGKGPAGKTEADLGSNSLTFTVLQDFGAETVRVWLSGMQRVMNHYITATGLSIHYEDIVPPETSAFQQHRDEKKVPSYREKWAAIRRDVERALSDPRLARRTSVVPTKKQAFFFEVMEKARQMGRELYNRELNKQVKLTPGSGIHIVDSGSKGSREHLYMMGMCVGIQQHAGSNIMSRGEFFQNTAYKPEAHGYLTESFEEGLSDAGTLHLSSRARHESLVAVQKVPDTGTKSKNLSNYMAEQCVENDGSVRESDKRIIQFYYGDDQIDPAAIERLYGNRSPSLWFETPRSVSPPDLVAMVDSVQEMYVRMADSLPLEIAPYTFPFHPARMIARFESNPYLVVNPNTHHIDIKKEPESVSYDQRLDTEVLLPWLHQFGYKCFGDTQYFAAHRATLRDMINPWRLRHVRTREKIHELLQEVYKKLYKSRITPYTAVGVAAAQSMCQPLIQSNLKSGHNIAGQVQRGGTDSVDPRAFLFSSPNRLNAVINVSDIKNKSTMLVALKQPWSSSQLLANACGLRLQARILNDLKKSVEYFSSPAELKEEWVLPSLMLHMDCYKQCVSEGSLSHPVAKITFHKELCRALDITMMEIATIMIAQWKNQASVVHDEQECTVYVYLYLKPEKVSSSSSSSSKQQQKASAATTATVTLTENDRQQGKSLVEKKISKEKKRNSRKEKQTKAVKEVDGSVAQHISSLQFDFGSQGDSKTHLQQRREEMKRIVTEKIGRVMDRMVKVTKKGTFCLRQILESSDEYSIKKIDQFHHTATVCLNVSQTFCQENDWTCANIKSFVHRVLKPHLLTAASSIVSNPPKAMEIVMRAETKDILFQNAKLAVERLLCKTQIRGLANVLFCVPEEIHRWKFVPGKGIERLREWALRVTGSNYANLMLFPFVDFERSSTSFVHDVTELMGIEAARICQFETLDIASREGGTDQDLRPLSLIADETTAFPHVNPKMKMTGPNAMSEKGLCTTHESAFLRRSLFRKPANVFVDAAKEGLVDNISSFRAAVWMGKTTPMGTGKVHLLPEITHQPILIPSKTWHSLGLSSAFASATAIIKHAPNRRGIALSAVAKALFGVTAAAADATAAGYAPTPPAWTLASSLAHATSKLIDGVECVASSLWAHSKKDERMHCWSRVADESGIVWVPRALLAEADKSLIVETRFDASDSQWKFERARPDKHRANEWSTIESTFQQSILQPIGIEDICPDSLCRDHQPLYRQHELTSLEIVPSVELRTQWKTQMELFR